MAGMSSLGVDQLEVDEEGRSSSELSAGMGGCSPPCVLQVQFPWLVLVALE